MGLNKIIASALGALMLSSPALAAGGRSLANHDGHTEVNQSSAKCEVVAIGYSEVSNKKAIVDLSAEAAAHICGKGVRKESEIVEDTASAFALAVAAASVKCELKGDTYVKVDASASAKAKANIWVAAYADAFASAGVCDTCDAYAGSFVYLEKYVFLKAVAEADIKLKAYTKDDGHLVFKVLDFQAEVKKVVVTAFAKALAAAADLKKKEGCLAWANAGGCIYTPEHPDTVYPHCDGCEGDDCLASAECTAASVSVGAIKEIDAIAVASAKAASYSCGHTVSIVELETSASALAKALAIAISFAYAECKVDHGWACAYAGTEIEQTAEAVAYAFADLWVGAWTCEHCDATVDAIAKAHGSVLVKAATDAYAVVCASNGHWKVADLEVEIKAASLCAIAEAHAIAISASPYLCLAGGVVYADASQAKCPNPHH